MKVPVWAVTGGVTLPVPVNMLQLPMPVVKVTAVTVVFGDAPQMVCVNGLMEGLLFSGSNLIVAVAELAAHVVPLAMVQTKIVVPVLRPVKLLFPAFAFDNVPLPCKKVQVPVPVVGLLPVRIVLALLMHKV